MSTPDHAGQSAEDRLIAQFFRPLARQAGAVGLQDDAAFYTPPAGCDLVVTKDAIVSGVHFLPDDPPDTIGRKALRVNLSDLAAKGAGPAGFLLALGLPDVQPQWLQAFARALGDDAETFGCPLLGGDTVKTTGPLFISITAFGQLPRGSMVHRHGAKPGDHVFVSGTIGDAVLGLRVRRNDQSTASWGLDGLGREHLETRYLIPQPRTALAVAVRTYASAAMDVSDGLAGDLTKLCGVSRVSAEIHVGRIPLSNGARTAVASEPALTNAILTGGDDYEILCVVPDPNVAGFLAAVQQAKVQVTEIGRTVDGSAPPAFIGSNGQALSFQRASFSHF